MIVWNRQALDELQTEAAQKILDAVGEQAEIRAKAIVPVRTGRLQNSIHYEPMIYGREGWLMADAPYAAYVELGTARMAAQPYLRPAVMEATQLVT